MVLTYALRSIAGTNPVEAVISTIASKVVGSCIGDERNNNAESKPLKMQSALLFRNNPIFCERIEFSLLFVCSIGEEWGA